MEPADVTTFGSNDKSFIPGLKDGTFSFNGLFAASTVAVDDIVNYLDGALGGSTKVVLTVDVERSTGGRALMMQADENKYDISSPVEDVVSVSVDSQGSNGYHGGRMLRPLAAATSTGSNTGVATPGTTAAGGTTGGGVAHLHVTAFGSTKNGGTFKVQHSTSGSTWADLITFSTLAGDPTFQRSTVAGTVKERLRSTLFALSSGAGSTAKSVTASVAFTRRVRT